MLMDYSFYYHCNMIIDDGLRIVHDDGAWKMQIYANIEGTFPADDPFHGAKNQSEPSKET